MNTIDKMREIRTFLEEDEGGGATAFLVYLSSIEGTKNQSQKDVVSAVNTVYEMTNFFKG